MRLCGPEVYSSPARQEQGGSCVQVAEARSQVSRPPAPSKEAWAQSAGMPQPSPELLTTEQFFAATRWRATNRPSCGWRADCCVSCAAVKMQLNIPLPLPVSFCVLSPRLCRGDAEAQGSEVAFSKRPGVGTARIPNLADV